MRKTKALVALCFVMLVSPMLMGAASITLTVTPNPGGAGSKLMGNGTWALDKGTTFGSISFQTTILNSNPAQTTFAGATVAGANWSSTLSVTPNTYTLTTARMIWVDGMNNPQMTSVTAPGNQVVK